jgi:hypothetical protein
VIRRIDHIGLVAPSWDVACELLVDGYGFESLYLERHPEGVLYEPENTRNHFVSLGAETVIEVLVPQDEVSAIWRGRAPACTTSPSPVTTCPPRCAGWPRGGSNRSRT